MARPIKDLTGTKFGKLTAVQFSHLEKQGAYRGAHWHFACECGGSIVALGLDVRRGRISHCGCERVRIVAGHTYYKLTAVGPAFSSAFSSAFATQARHALCKSLWRFSCECGGQRIAEAGSVISGYVRSCGCLQRERTREVNTTHGQHGSKEYTAWVQLRVKGIHCKRWEDFALFFADVGPAPHEDCRLQRPNKNAPYGPDNCQWRRLGEYLHEIAAERRAQAERLRRQEAALLELNRPIDQGELATLVATYQSTGQLCERFFAVIRGLCFDAWNCAANHHTDDALQETLIDLLPFLASGEITEALIKSIAQAQLNTVRKMQAAYDWQHTSLFWKRDGGREEPKA